ncbi:MAG: GntR family transcriptional regulator [Victivallaceae bacterium]
MSIPAYQQIKDVLKEEIKQGKYKPGATLPSVNQLAKDFSTSRNTSVKAITDLVHEGIVYTVQGKGTLVSDFRREIKNAASGKNRNSSVPCIGILLADFDNIDHPYMAKIIKGISEKAKNIKCNLKVFCISNYSINDFIHNEDFDGLIVLTELPQSSIFMLRQNKIPFVLANNDIYGEELFSVTVDTFSATCQAIKYLYNLGHKEICVLAGPHYARSTPISYAAYKYAMNECGIEVNESFFKSCEYGEDGGYSGFSSFIQAGNIPTAVFALEDYIACGVIKAAAEKSLKVPDDLSVIGNGDMLNGSTNFSLTTFNNRLDEIGGLCLELLDKQLKNEPVKNRKISLKPELIIRESCAKK